MNRVLAFAAVLAATVFLSGCGGGGGGAAANQRPAPDETRPAPGDASGSLSPDSSKSGG